MEYRRKKTYTNERIADLYLKELFKLEKAGLRMKFLIEVLEKRNIYYNQEIMKEVINLLKKEGLIRKIFGICKFSYSTNTTSKQRTETLPMAQIVNAEFFRNLEGSVELFELTNKGINFVSSKQVVDQEGKRKRIENRKKWSIHTLMFLFKLVLSFLGFKNLNLN